MHGNLLIVRLIIEDQFQNALDNFHIIGVVDSQEFAVKLARAYCKSMGYDYNDRSKYWFATKDTNLNEDVPAGWRGLEVSES